MRFLLIFLAATLTATHCVAESGRPAQVSATIQDLVPASQLASFAKTYPVDQPIHWKLYAPNEAAAPGVVVFISPRETGDPPAEWIALLNERNLLWIAACDFGNGKPTAQRMLAALMGLTYAQREYSIDKQRIYVAGMSGGGRVASKAITKFPRLFNGAIYIAGADALDASDAQLVSEVARNRYVFITGENDFNRHEIHSVFNAYRSAGITQSYLMDLPHFGHQLPNVDQLRDALTYLDAGEAPR